LASVPLALASADGTMRKTQKSKLMEIMELPTVDTIPSNSTYIVDVIAQIRSLVGVPETFRELARKLLSLVPKQHHHVYFACDRYDENNIKNAEHSLRGESQQYSVLKPDMKIPELANFLKNGTNKDGLLEVFENVVCDERKGLGNRIVYIALKSHCMKIWKDGFSIVDQLEIDHMEADTMISYLSSFTNQSTGLCSVIRSTSGDVDIPVILLGTIERGVTVILDNGTGNTRKYFSVHDSALSNSQRKALVGFHAFTGNG
jgi:hypothetical protein